MKAMILCGGRGTRLREHTETLPKPLVEIGGRPILWHIMKSYAAHGITDFILCLGYKGHLIKDYFLNYEALSMDFSISLGKPDSIQYHGTSHQEDGWNITLVDTGRNAMTGARVKRASRYLGADEPTFALTYGDGVSNVDLRACLKFHREHGRHAAVTGVQPAGRFGELQVDKSRVTAFTEKPEAAPRRIDGGFFFLNRAFLDYLSEDDDCVLEQSPLKRCATDGQLGFGPRGKRDRRQRLGRRSDRARHRPGAGGRASGTPEPSGPGSTSSNRSAAISRWRRAYSTPTTRTGAVGGTSAPGRAGNAQSARSSSRFSRPGATGSGRTRATPLSRTRRRASGCPSTRPSRSWAGGPA